jgi:hypothetical protein
MVQSLHHRIIVLVAVFLGILAGASSFAQPARIQHTVVKQAKAGSQAMGRDLWFTMAKNYDNQGGKYYELFVTGPKKTTVNIEVVGVSQLKIPIKPFEIAYYFVPLGWEVTTSGVVESKAIHVWSNDADVTAYLLSRNPATSDGMYIIPSIGWGTEYVVAAYESLYEGFGTPYDYPSEFSIVANQDYTLCKVVPSVDIRANGLPQTVLHKKGVPFEETLMRGQVVQYMAVLPDNADDYDMTGTVVTSNKPVGIVGASQCPNIPPDWPYCDHVCDMIPPVRTWSNTYCTIPFANRRGGDTYLCIASKDGQTIYRNGAVHCILNKYEKYYRPDVSVASTWSSDAPFLLVQYINSTTWQDENGQDNAGIGDPAMVIVNPKEQYTKTVVFNTPLITTGTGFQNYCNVIVDSVALKTTTMDGIPIKSYPNVSEMGQIPYSRFIGFRVRGLGAKGHIIQSDSGTGVYIYGYGSYDSYAWTGNFGTRTVDDPDTIPPVVSPTGSCYCATVGVADNHKLPPASKLSSITVDTSYNMTVTFDPDFVTGSGIDTSFYSMCVTDPSQDALLVMSIYDISGNKTTVTSTYKPMFANIQPPLYNYGTGIVGTKLYTYFTITNTGEVPYSFLTLKLILGNKGFLIDSADKSDIPVGGTRKIKISFEPILQQTVTDTIFVDDGCSQFTAVVTGNGGQPDFVLANYNFHCVLVGDKSTKQEFLIANTSSKAPITVTDIKVDDPVHFVYDPTAPGNLQTPFTIPPISGGFNGQKKLWITFKPDAVMADPPGVVTKVHVTTTEAGTKDAEWRGCGIAPAGQTVKDETASIDCERPYSFTFNVLSTGSAPLTIDKIPVIGDPAFGQPKQFTDQNGNVITLPHQIAAGEQINAFVDFTAPAKASGTYTAKIFAVSDNNDTTNDATMTVKAIYREFAVTNGAVSYPIVPFGSAPQTGGSLQFCNTGPDTLTVSNVTIAPSKYSAAFSYTGFTVNGVPVTMPAMLAPNECMDVAVSFDPTISPDSVQTAEAVFSTNACKNAIQNGTIQGGAWIGPPTVLGFNAPVAFSCNSNTNNVSVKNPNLAGSPDLTIKSVAMSGADPASFIPQAPSSTTVKAGTTETIPVIFQPVASVPGRSYTATVEVTVGNGVSPDTVLKAAVTGTSAGVATSVSSQFAAADMMVKAGTTGVRLPINLSTKTDDPAVKIDMAGIQNITLTYRYNTDLLHLDKNNIPGAVSGLPGGWSVDASSNLTEGKNGTLILVLKNTSGPLTDAITSLGTISFQAMLTTEEATSVVLESAVYRRGDNSLVQNCVSVQTDSTATQIEYECGNPTIRTVLNGNTPAYIEPVHPNPAGKAEGNVLNFRFALRHTGNVSLVILDELGHEAARVISNSDHPGGTFEVRYDVSNLPSGSYTYRLMLDKYVTSGKLVVNH